MEIIKPTIGRKVWYWPTKHDKIGRGCMQTYGGEPEQPLDATIIAVHSDRLVNLYIIDHFGRTHVTTSTQLLQPGEDIPFYTGINPVSKESESIRNAHATWMPYQVGQAQKHAGEQAAKKDPADPATGD